MTPKALRRDQIKREEEKNITMENKQFTKAIIDKTPNDKGEMVFTASTANVDRESDIIKADGWQLDNFKDGGPLLWGHDQTKLPIGRVLWVKVDNGKLVGKAKFNGQTQLSTDVEKLVRSGDLKGLSVGFRPMDMKMNNEGGRTFTKQELLEISVVNVPANPDAIIHTIKSLEIKSEPVIRALTEKESVNECVDRKVPIILEENPDMDNDQAVAMAHDMCEEDSKSVKATECPMDNPDCPNYSKEKSLPLIDLDKLVKKVDSLNDKMDTLIKENNSEEKVEMDLRERKLQILRRAVSKYLKEKSNNSEV